MKTLCKKRIATSIKKCLFTDETKEIQLYITNS